MFMARRMIKALVLACAILLALPGILPLAGDGAYAEDMFRFTVQGIDYKIFRLDDEPADPLVNLMDGLPGHAVLFAHDVGIDAEQANKALYAGVRLILPDGSEVKTYGNDGNIENPYTLFFGLPDDVLLADCIMKVPTDDGEQQFPLGGEAPEAIIIPTQQPPLEQHPAEKPAEILPVPMPEGAFDLAAVLLAEAEAAEDPWRKAIWEAGARNVDWDGDSVSFQMRSFDPKIKELGKYADDPSAWFWGFLENAAGYDLEATLSAVDGIPDPAGLKSLRSQVRAAATNAKTEFNQRAVRVAISDQLIPEPMEKIASLEALYAEDMSVLYTDVVDAKGREGTTVYEYAPLFMAQVSQKLGVSDGPHALTLTCSCADPETLLKTAYAEALGELCMIYKANQKDEEEIADYLLEALIGSANSIRSEKTKGTSVVWTLDVDAMLNGDFGEAYADYLTAYDFSGTVSALCSAVLELPDAPALPFPKSGRIGGGSSGTKVIVKAPKDEKGRYVQLRRLDSDEVKSTLFIRPGSSATAYVPKGMYYLLIASGYTWYGEESLFGESGSYSRSTNLEVLSSEYYHTVTLQVKDGEEGNMSSFGADMEDFF